MSGRCPTFPTRALDAETEVSLVAEEEETLVEEARAGERLAPRDHERPGRPVALKLVLVQAQIGLALAEPPRTHWEALGAERLPERPHCIREAPNRREEALVGGDLLYAREPDRGCDIQPADEIGEDPWRISVSGLRKTT